MMAEVLVRFDRRVAGHDGTAYDVRVCGRENASGLWEGWLEFVPEAGGVALRTGRETTQPNHDDLYYWATGLTSTYIEGALTRAGGGGAAPHGVSRFVYVAPVYDGPAE
jgi:hypothetical protein